MTPAEPNDLSPCAERDVVDEATSKEEAAEDPDLDRRRQAVRAAYGPDRFPFGGIVRRARRIADMSQRELARGAGTSHTTIGRVEAGTLVPAFDLLRRILAVAQLWLVVVDAEGHVVLPMRDLPDTRDGAERRYPSHLDTILDPVPGEWWGDTYGLYRPPETFSRSRAKREMQRKRSVWEVRVAQHRHEPMPPKPRAGQRWDA